jgi:uncharacterized protein DUF3892
LRVSAQYWKEGHGSNRDKKMAQTLEITCISKTRCGGPHERIDYIGGSAWRFTAAQAISFIEGGMFDFFVKAGGRALRVVVAIRSGEKYLKTLADGEAPDDLLSAPGRVSRASPDPWRR